MKKLTFFFVFFALSMISFGQTILWAGSKAPLFKARSDDGSVWKLADHLGQKNIVLYFYPGAMTQGCTKQACSYRDHMSDFIQADAIIVGISGDEQDALKAFKKSDQLNFTLLSDKDGDIAKLYGVPVGEGGTISKTIDNVEVVFKRGITTKRYTFIIGKDGLIKYMNTQVDPENDYKAVLEMLTQK